MELDDRSLKKIHKAFKHVDEDGNGHIDVEELDKFLAA